MNSNLIGFNPMDVAPATGGSGKALPVSPPEGHVVIMIGAEWATNKDPSTGQHLVTTLRIVGGPHDGTEGHYRLNLGHQRSAEAVSIARSELSAICHCTGWTSPLQQDLLADLYNRQFRVVVALQSGEDAQKRGFTEVKAILDLHGNKAGQGGGGAAATSPAPGPVPIAPAPGPAPNPGGFPVAAPPANIPPAATNQQLQGAINSGQGLPGAIDPVAGQQPPVQPPVQPPAQGGAPAWATPQQ